MAAGLQYSTEQRLKPLLSRFIVNSVEYVCLTGGLFLNCQVTGKIRQWFPHLKGYSCRLPRTTAELSVHTSQRGN